MTNSNSTYYQILRNQPKSFKIRLGKYLIKFHLVIYLKRKCIIQNNKKTLNTIKSLLPSIRLEKKVNKSFLMDNLCVNVRKVNKGEKQPFTIKLLQKRTDESKLPVL